MTKFVSFLKKTAIILAMAITAAAAGVQAQSSGTYTLTS